MQRHAERRLDTGLERAIERRAAGGGVAQGRRLDRTPRLPRMLDESREHGRYALENSEFLIAQQAQRFRGIETGHKVIRRAIERRAEKHRGEAKDMAHRQAAIDALARRQTAQITGMAR